MEQVLVHLASGIGNIVLATPLLIALEEMGFATDVRLDADYPATGGFARRLERRQTGFHSIHPSGHAPIQTRPALRSRPSIGSVFPRQYRDVPGVVPRPPDNLFYRDEQSYYVAFARALGYTSAHAPFPRLPIATKSANARWGVTSGTVALAPGCKTGDMAAKRWPHFAELARGLADVAIV